MLSGWFRPRRTEELVAAGRLLLAVFSLAGLWVDPSQPVFLGGWTYLLLGVYAAYAIGVAAATLKSTAPPRGWQIANHAIDLSVFAVLVFATAGADGPLFVWFSFALFSAGVRFGIVPTSITAAVVIVTSVVVSLALGKAEAAPLSSSMIQPIYLGVVATLILYAIAWHQRLKDEFVRLAGWPREAYGRRDDLARGLLQYASELMRVNDGVLLWEESEEPWLYIARWSGGAFVFEQQPPDIYPPPEQHPGSASFLAVHRGKGPRTTTFDHAKPLSVIDGLPLHPALVQRLGTANICSTAVDGENLTGRIFFMTDARELTVDDVVLAEVAARFVAARIDQFTLLRRIEESAVMRERARISRDLHDSILQSLTGASYQLESLMKMIPVDAVAARDRVGDVQKIIASDQRDLRELVLSLRPRRGMSDASEATILMNRLSSLAKRFERQWGLKVDIEVSSLPAAFDAALRHEIYNVASEAIANAAKHADATSVSVSVARHEDRIRMVVEDNGKGFPFQGRFNLVTLEYMKRGPVTLKERVGLLGGELVVESRPDGTRLEIELPSRIEELS